MSYTPNYTADYTSWGNFPHAQHKVRRLTWPSDAPAALQGPDTGSLLAVGLLLSLAGWGVEAVALHATVSMIGLELQLLASLGIYGLSVAIGALSFLPGGLGGTEATMILLLTLAGASVADAGAATILVRLATLWFAVLLGVPLAASLGRAEAPKEAYR